MIKTFSNFFFPVLVLLSAFSVSASAAFYSITGLSKLFAGASLEVIVMATSLEASKLIIASFLYRYWDSMNKLLRVYLSVATAVLVLITSVGIYGFLSAAYNETATKSAMIEREIEVIELKKDRYIQERESLISEKESLDASIAELRQGLANNKIQYKDSETGKIITTTSTSNRKIFEKQLDEALISSDDTKNKLSAVNDSISKYDIQILNIQAKSDIAGELGPLKYISNLTNKSMDSIINYLLLVIIFVFDPLAISLVIAANYALEQLKTSKNDEKIEQEDANETDEESKQQNQDADDTIEDEQEEGIEEQSPDDLKSFLDDEPEEQNENNQPIEQEKEKKKNL